MEVKGIVAAFVEVPQKDLVDFNTWYDFDHAPEFIALPEFTVGRRYVATPELKALRRQSTLPEMPAEGTSYFTTYYLNTDDIPKAMASFRGKSAEIRAAKRGFRSGKALDVGFYRLEHASVRKGIPVSHAAIPYLGHRGLFVTFMRVADPDMRDTVNAWWRETHGPDLVAVPGIVAALRFARFEEPNQGRYLNLYLLDGDPVTTAAEQARHGAENRAKGRAPAPGGASAPLFTSYYQSIIPTRYDFRVQ